MGNIVGVAQTEGVRGGGVSVGYHLKPTGSILDKLHHSIVLTLGQWSHIIGPETNKQTNKVVAQQITQQTNKQTLSNKQTNKQLIIIPYRQTIQNENG